jgi:hypothetical protein
MKKLASFSAQTYHDTLFKKSYRLNDVAGQIVKVGFDVVKFKDDDDASHLWEVQSSDDGDYIVALYDVAATKTASAINPWKVTVADDHFDVYCNDKFVARFGASEIGIPTNELYLVPTYLPGKLARDGTFAQKLLKLAEKKAKFSI